LEKAEERREELTDLGLGLVLKYKGEMTTAPFLLKNLEL
jgi:hypothetical protein